MQNVLPLLSRMQGFLEEWKGALKSGQSLSRYAIPLSHKYTTQNLSLTRLKGEDSELARFFLGFEGLEVFVVLESKYDTGIPDDSWQPPMEEPRGRKRSFDEFEQDYINDSEDDYDSEDIDGNSYQRSHYSFLEICDTQYSTELWIDRYGTSHNFPQSLSINLNRELVGKKDAEALFEGQERTKQNYTEYAMKGPRWKIGTILPFW